MMTILVTGFEPFGGETVNPSWEAVRRLNSHADGALIQPLLVPTSYVSSVKTVTAAIDRVHPAVVLMVGQAGGRAELSVERVAVNCDDAQVPDNEGVLREDVPIVSGGPAAYLATLPLKQVLAGLRGAGFPVAVSNTAGLFVCNHLFYGVLHHIAVHDLDTQAGFVHVPFLPGQVMDKPGTPSMSLETIVAGLDCIVAILTSNARP
jgi:pyroglutamyl-peptidase